MTKSVLIEGTEYVPKSELAASSEGLPYVIVRSRDAGVFAGYLKSRDGAEVHLQNARRIWYWDGAATLSQLANNGTSKPNNCKFPAAVSEITVLGVCEIIQASEEAQQSIEGVAVWEQ